MNFQSKTISYKNYYFRTPKQSKKDISNDNFQYNFYQRMLRISTIILLAVIASLLKGQLQPEEIMPEDIYQIYLQRIGQTAQKQFFSNQNVRTCVPPTFDKDYNFLDKSSSLIGDLAKTQIFKKTKPRNEKQKLFRLRVFEDNLRRIKNHNLNPKRTYNMKINEFALLTQLQFLKSFANLQIPAEVSLAMKRKVKIQPLIFQTLRSSELMDTLKVDYSCKSGKALHQGLCGACYAISTADTGAIIKALYTPQGDYAKLSAQQIVSSGANDTYGCDGGTFKGAFAYMINEGLHLSWSYPYQNQFDDIANAALILESGLWREDNFTYQSIIPYGNCNELLQILERKPIAVAVSTSFDTAFYSQGTLTGPNNNSPNHGVVLVGYDPVYGFYVKNSWGDQGWGYDGYGWIARDQNMGICQYAVNIITDYDSGLNGPLHSCKRCE